LKPKKPNRTQTGKKPEKKTEPNQTKTEPNRKTKPNRFEPVFVLKNQTEAKPVGLNRFWFFKKKTMWKNTGKKITKQNF
jgi:hypothetical protein